MTKIEMKSEDGFIRPMDVKVFDGSGNEIKGIMSIDIRASYDSIVVAEIELSPAQVIVGEIHPEYYMVHPITGKQSLIKQIEFYDDETWSAELNG